MDTPIANDVRAESTGSPERPHRAGGGEPVGGPSRRFSAHRISNWHATDVSRLFRFVSLRLCGSSYSNPGNTRVFYNAPNSAA